MKAKFKTKLQTPPFFCKNFASKVVGDGFSRFLLRFIALGCLIYGSTACSTVSSTHLLKHTPFLQKTQSTEAKLTQLNTNKASRTSSLQNIKLWEKQPSANIIRKKAIERSYSQLGYLFGAHPPLFLELPISDFKHVKIQGSILKPRGSVDLWDRIRAGMTLNLDVDNALIEKHREWYISHPKHLEKIQERASRYLYFIVQELESRNLPLELALLPAVESAYNPFAYSHASASGLWQFIPNTGKQYGLKQNGWYDGRRDVIASTHAAIEYLSDLNKNFDGDWMLSLAAYNTGSFNISKAQLRNQILRKPQDYWSLTLSKETQNYVPRFVALAQLLSEPEKYGVEWTPIPNKPEFTIVTLPHQVDLLKAAKAIDMEPSAFFQLNAGYKRWSSAPVGPHRIVIPIEHSEKFQQALAYGNQSLNQNQHENRSPYQPRTAITSQARTAITSQPRTAITSQSRSVMEGWYRYLVKAGDSLGQISQLFNVSVQEIKSVNQLSSNHIRVGDTLLLPRKAPNLSYNGDISASKKLALAD